MSGNDDKSIDIKGSNVGAAVTGDNAHVNIYQNAPQPTAEPFKSDLTRLPVPTTRLTGRAKELTLLTNTFHTPQTRLAVLVADGGAGKSTLTDAWLKQLAPDYGGVRRVFGWSFYSQGHHKQYSDSGAFFREVLPFLGQAEIPQDEVDKGRALAQCLAVQPVLLVLDGLEPLQLDVTVHGGTLNDIALREFFTQLPRALAQQPDSFVLVSSRQPLAELDTWTSGSYLQHMLAPLTPTDGAALLAAKGVMESDAARAELSNAVGGHALTLALLGDLLKQRFGGRIVEEWQQAAWELDTTDDDNPQARHAQRVLDWHEQHLDDNARRFLLLLGLFDRPMGWQEKNVLFEQADWAKPLAALDKSDVAAVEQTLTAAGLLAPVDNLHDRDEWDCHALIRSWAARRFANTAPDDYQQAHRVLFAYYQSVPEQHQPDSLDNLLPLYCAIPHGCLAGEYQTALYEVYYNRIDRGSEGYSSKKLGAWAQNLGAIAAFFPQGWQQPSHTGLSEADQSWLLAEAAFCLMSLGRLREAVLPREADLALSIKIEDWKEAAIAAQNLVDLHLPLGNLAQVEQAARQAIEFAERSADLFEQTKSHSYLGTVLYRQGRLEEAATAFEQAEALQAERQPSLPRLYSLPGAQYCALLLDRALLAGSKNLPGFQNPLPSQGQALAGLGSPPVAGAVKADVEAVLERGEQIHQWAINANADLLTMALDHLTLARAHTALNHPDAARTAFDQAVTGIEAAKLPIFAPTFYLARAAFLLTQGEPDTARRDLDAAWAIIQRCEMALYAVDAQAVEAAYWEAEGNRDKAKVYRDKVERGIVETGYELRRIVPFMASFQVKVQRPWWRRWF